MTGNGAPESPFVISAASAATTIVHEDSTDIDFTVTGSGTPDDPLTVSADLTCLDCSAPGNVGDVLTLQADGSYSPGPPSTVPPGTIVTGPSITGSATIASPLQVCVATYADLKALAANC